MLNRIVFYISAVMLLLSFQSKAYGYDALEVCRGQSNFPPDVSECMDNYLDLLDQNLGDLTIFINGELRGAERAAFGRAQNSFYSFRRENCLWYLALGGQRIEAEQVAKNCLADMSQARLAELQGLIAEYQTPGTENLPDVNPFDEPVDSASDGDALAAATELEVTAVNVPTDAPAELSATEPTGSDASNDEGLSAFLGEWEVICTQADSSKRCTFDVPLVSQDGDSNEAVMRVTRRADEGTRVELRFPGKQIESPDNVLWQVDSYSFGSVPGSIISVNDGVVRQVINERRFLLEDLVPLFRSGSQVGITLIEKVGEREGEEYEATLGGFSRALTFADEYINGDLQ